MAVIVCSNCFSNDGLRRVLGRHGIASDLACLRFSSADGRKLDVDALKARAQECFAQGSVASETLAPVFQLNHRNPSPTVLDPTLAADADLLRSIAGLVVFDYGPPMWRLVYTDHNAAAVPRPVSSIGTDGRVRP